MVEVLFSVLPGDDLPCESVIFAREEAEEFLVDEGLGALQEEREVVIRDDIEADEVLLVEDVVDWELAEAGIVEAGGELSHRAAGGPRGGHFLSSSSHQEAGGACSEIHCAGLDVTSLVILFSSAKVTTKIIAEDVFWRRHS